MPQHKYGCIPSRKDPRDHHIARYIKTLDVLPEEYIIPNPPPVLDQDGVGACVAHALCSLAEWHNQKDTGQYRALSPGYIYGRRDPEDYQGDGMQPRDALKDLVARGVPPKDVFPYLGEMPAFATQYKDALTAADQAAFPQHIQAFAAVHTAAERKSALVQLGPLPRSIPVYPSFEDGPVNGIIMPPKPNEPVLGYHEILDLAFDREAALIQNSWGTSWGDKGRARLHNDYPMQELWAVTDFVPNQPEPAREIEMGIDTNLMLADGRLVQMDTAPFLLRDFAERVKKAIAAGTLRYIDDPDGQILDLGDWKYRADRVFDPLRAPFEAMGYSVVIDLESRKVFIRR